MLQTFQHNAAFRKRDLEVYQQLKPFLFYENLSMRAVYFLISTVVNFNSYYSATEIICSHMLIPVQKKLGDTMPWIL